MLKIFYSGIIYISCMKYSTNLSNSENLKYSENKKREEAISRNKKEAIKLLVRDYGKIAIIFHVTISLISLGIIYTLIVRFVKFIYCI